MAQITGYLRKHLNSFRTIILGFFLLILVGAILLSLPISSASHHATPFGDALFTSTSAACVTGLVVYNTATYWSLFGKIVILVLIQIGGIGVITAIIFTLVITGRRIGLLGRLTMQDAISAPQTAGIIRFTCFFLAGTLIVEGIGAIALAPVFIKDFGILKGICYAVFHSISAFCNAGFDLMGTETPFCSLTGYADNTAVNLIICLLIIIGGIGFLTWQDLLKHPFRFKPLRLQTKIILITNLVLIGIPFLIFLFFEYHDFPLQQRVLQSLFQAVTPRTAGFNTADYGSMSESGLLLTIVLMIIGGAPGSTAGGMKVTTFFAIAAGTSSCLKREKDVNCFNRRIERDDIQHAMTLASVYLVLLLLGTFVLCMGEQIPLAAGMFECASALGTVGLTTGITPTLSGWSRLMLTSFMFFGRVGGLTLAYGLISQPARIGSRYLSEKITIG